MRSKKTTAGASVLPAPTAAARRREARTAERKAAILQAALQQFSVHGMSGTTMERIAEAADLSKTNLFYYFQSKEEIYDVILRDLLTLWLKPLRDISPEGDVFVMLGDYIAQKLVFSRDHPEASRLFCLEMVRGAPLLGPMLGQELRPLMAEKVAVVRGWIEQGLMAAIDPNHLFFAIWATTQHYADFAVQVQAVTGQGLDDPAYLANTTADVQQLLLDGLRPNRKRRVNKQARTPVPVQQACSDRLF